MRWAGVRRRAFVLPVMAIVVLTGYGGERNQPVAGESLHSWDVMQRFGNETGEVLSRSRDGVMTFGLDRGGEKERKYGRFWLNVLPRGGGITAPANQPPEDLRLENQLRDMLEEGEPDDEGVRWSFEREGWVAVKQYAANVVVVWQGGREKADARWHRLDRVLRRVTVPA
jgi:hypothetical protein